MCMTFVRAAFLIMTPQWHHGGGVQNVGVLALGHGVVDDWLETPLVDHKICRSDGRNLSWRELEIMRFGPRLGEVGDDGMIAGDSLGDELERIGRCDHLQDTWTSGVRGPATRRSAAHHEQRKRGGSEGIPEASLHLHENDYHLELAVWSTPGPRRWSGHPPAGVSLRSWAAGILASSLSKTSIRSN